MKLLFFFIDGLGLGNHNPKINPLIKEMKFFNSVFGKDCFVNNGKMKESGIGVLKPIDANLSIDGLPQSATGQTALFTGINASELLGYHLTGIPNKKLTRVILKHSVLKQLKKKGYSVTGANAYSQQYFDKVKTGEMHLSASSLAIRAAKEPYRMLKDLKLGNAVFMDITNANLVTYGYKVKKVRPKTAAKNMLSIMKENDFTFYEYFLTDYYGHLRGTRRDIKRILKHIDKFSSSLVKNMESNFVIIISSDHGNIENIEKKPHTRNPVPFIVFTASKQIKQYLIEKVNSIVDVTPAIISAFEKFLPQ